MYSNLDTRKREALLLRSLPHRPRLSFHFLPIMLLFFLFYMTIPSQFFSFPSRFLLFQTAPIPLTVFLPHCFSYSYLCYISVFFSSSFPPPHFHLSFYPVLPFLLPPQWLAGRSKGRRKEREWKEERKKLKKKRKGMCEHSLPPPSDRVAQWQSL